MLEDFRENLFELDRKILLKDGGEPPSFALEKDAKAKDNLFRATLVQRSKSFDTIVVPFEQFLSGEVQKYLIYEMQLKKPTRDIQYHPQTQCTFSLCFYNLFESIHKSLH